MEELEPICRHCLQLSHSERLSSLLSHARSVEVGETVRKVTETLGAEEFLLNERRRVICLEKGNDFARWSVISSFFARGLNEKSGSIHLGIVADLWRLWNRAVLL